METQRNSLCGSLESRFILAVVVLVCGASQKWWHNYWLVVHLPSFVTCRAHRGRWGWAGGTNPVSFLKPHQCSAFPYGTESNGCTWKWLHALQNPSFRRTGEGETSTPEVWVYTHQPLYWVHLVQGLALFCLQNYLNCLWHWLNKVLETFLMSILTW